MIQPGMYQHFKGGVYRVLSIAIHSETSEAFVVYQDDSGHVWVRPEAMFAEEVIANGRTQRRFERVREIAAPRERKYA